MAWSEPGKNKKNDFPQRPDKGPPDLDELLKKGWEQLLRLLGKKNPSPKLGSTQNSIMATGWIIGVLFFLWILSGVFIISPAEKAVILQFGRYKETVGPGPHWFPRFIQSVIKINVQKISTYAYSSSMLTKDQNIVDVSIAIQYRISNIQHYLFGVKNPIQSLQQATASALRYVVGNENLDDILTTGRAAVRNKVSVQLDKILTPYQMGLIVTDVALQPAKAPDSVKESFDDAIKALEDEQRYINQADAYAKQVLPQAQGQAKRLIAEAEAYRQQAVLKAKADSARYLAVLPAYLQAPRTTRDRLYLETMEVIFSKTNKILLDTKNGQNVIYLPLDKWNLGDRSELNNSASNPPLNSILNPPLSKDINNDLATERARRFIFKNPDAEVNMGDSRGK